MSADPLVPAIQRFPMCRVDTTINDEAPSPQRPFVLRGLTPAAAGPVGDGVGARHRTPSTQWMKPATTSLDNKQVDDSYPVPDD